MTSWYDCSASTIPNSYFYSVVALNHPDNFTTNNLYHILLKGLTRYVGNPLKIMSFYHFITMLYKTGSTKLAQSKLSNINILF